MTAQTIISATELADRLHNRQDIIIDCRFVLAQPELGLTAYQHDHIPGAHYAHLDDDLSSHITATSAATSGRHPLPNPDVLAKRFSAWGINADKQVIVYDDSHGSVASRLWWLLRWLGHNNVAVLDGGYSAWLERHLPINTSLPAPIKTQFMPTLQRDFYVSTDEVRQLLGNHQYKLLDARTPERFRGDVEPIDKKAGHIPGAINVPWQDNLNQQGTFLSAEQLRSFYQGLLGDTIPPHCILMCGSGVTACHSILAMTLAGLKGVKLYAGSWSEWITRADNPIALATGNPTG